MSREVHRTVNELSFPIDGLRFEQNSVNATSAPPGWFSRKLSSSPGPLISDFVTHETGFRYSTYGIHIGQDDRLTFMGENGQCIEGHFVDCREASSTLHRYVHIRFAPSLERRLVIPRGVAHTFDNLERIVTRDEPVWYSDEDNKDWNIDNDLISIQRTTALPLFPTVRGNRHILPDDAHQFMSRLSQTLLEDPKSYLARFLLKIGGKDQYVMFEPTSWSKDDLELRELLVPHQVPGVQVQRARYALTGPKSWTLVPSIHACVADVLYLPASQLNTEAKFIHARTRKWYTVLTGQGAKLTLRSIDCRRGSANFGKASEISIRCDPRLTFVIDHGIAYSLTCEEPLLIRCEHEIFADVNEPRADLPMFGQDLMLLSSEITSNGLNLPSLRCPDSVVYAIGKYESAAAR